MEDALGFPEARDLSGEVVRADQRVFRGSYSDVYMGWYRGEQVAIKDIAVLRGISTSSMRRKVNRERAIWAAMNHDNITPLYGYIENDPNCGIFGAFISPWYANTDAGAFFQSSMGRELGRNARLEIWAGVIRGVDYLHQFNPTVVHGDLKPGNVLIDDRLVPKICDFGLSCIFLKEGNTGMTTTTTHTGTARYLAYELVATGSRPTTASDVHALGCLGLEFIYNQVPYAQHQHNASGAITLDIHNGVPPATPLDNLDPADLTLWDIFQECWDLAPDNRPTATRLLELLTQFAEERKELVGHIQEGTGDIENSSNQAQKTGVFTHHEPVGTEVKPEETNDIHVPWIRVHLRLQGWAAIWSMSEFDSATTSCDSGKQINDIASTIWATQTYKRYIRTLLTSHPPQIADKLFVPPFLAEAINNAAYNGRHHEVAIMLRELWDPFRFKFHPRWIVALTTHRREKNHCVVHRYSLEDYSLTTYDTNSEKGLPDGRPLGWWFGIRIAFSQEGYPPADELVQRVVRISRPLQSQFDNAVAALAIWRNLMMGSKPTREVDLERLRTLVRGEVMALKKMKMEGRLST